MKNKEVLHIVKEE